MATRCCNCKPFVLDLLIAHLCFKFIVNTDRNQIKCKDNFTTRVTLTPYVESQGVQLKAEVQYLYFLSNCCTLRWIAEKEYEVGGVM